MKRLGLDELETAFAADPTRDELVVALVGALGMAGETDRMLRVALRADEVAGGSSVVRAVALGSAYEHAGRFGEAAAAFGRALRLDRQEPEAALGLARARMGLGDAAGAVAAARLAANLDDDSEVARLTLAEAHLLRGDAGEARAAAGDVPLERWSEWARARLEDADLLAEVGPGTAPNRLLDAAAAAARLGHLGAVRSLARRAAAEATRDCALLRRAGHLCLVVGLLDEAVELLGHVLALEPGDAPASDNLATAYLRMGFFEHAVKFASQAVATAPTEAVYHYNLGNAWAAFERPVEAARCYERALELDSELEEAAHNLAIVRQALDD